VKQQKLTCVVCNKELPEEGFYYSKTVCDKCYKKRVRYKHSRDYVDSLLPLVVETDGIFVFTAVMPNTGVHSEALDALESLCSSLGATMFCIGIKAHQKPLKDEELYYPRRLERVLQRDITIGDTRVADFRVAPQRMNPLASLDRVEYNKNIGIASPKQHSNVYPVGNEKLRRVFSTGTISLPAYRRTEVTGVIGEEAHKIGAVLVRVVGGVAIEIKPLEFICGGFTYNTIKYSRGAALPNAVDTIVFGDLHAESMTYTLNRRLLSIIELYNPRAIVLHDVVSGASVSHHNTNKPLTKPNISMLEDIERTRRLFGIIIEVCPDIQIILPDCNHDKHTEDYVASGCWVKDDLNRDTCIAMIPYLKRPRPLMSYILSETNDSYAVDPYVLLRGRDSHYIHGIDVSNHGHAHASGKKGSIDLFDRTHGRCITAHSHQIQWRNNAWSVGRFTAKRLGYNNYADVSEEGYIIIYADGCREIFNNSLLTGLDTFM